MRQRESLFCVLVFAAAIAAAFATGADANFLEGR